MTSVGLILGGDTDVHDLGLLDNHEVGVVLLDTAPVHGDQTDARATLADVSLAAGGREETDVLTLVVLAGVGQLWLEDGVVDVDRERLRHQLGHDTLVASSELPHLSLEQ